MVRCVQSLSLLVQSVLSLCVYKESFQLPPVSDLPTPLTNFSEIVISELDVYSACHHWIQLKPQAVMVLVLNGPLSTITSYLSAVVMVAH